MYREIEIVNINSSKYAFVNTLAKNEVKQYDCCTWIYRMNELDHADKSIIVIIFDFEGANAPLEDNMSYLELETYYLNEQARVINNAYKALQVACDMFKIAGFEHKAVIDEVIHQYNGYQEDTTDKWEMEDDNMTTEEKVDQLAEQIMKNLDEIESLGYEYAEHRIINISPIHEDKFLLVETW